MTEYVRFYGTESLYWQKHLLHSELELLGIIKKLRSYEKFRQEDFVLKVAVKNKIDGIIESLKLLDKLLPHDKLAGLGVVKRPPKSKEETKEEKENISLEQELEIIRRRLDKLRGI